MNAPLPKKVRLPRVARTESHAIHDDGHSWAVSYADFLMVLLSFFIIFFSIDSDKRSHLINQLQAGGDEKKGNASGSGVGGMDGTSLTAGNVAGAAAVNGASEKSPGMSDKSASAAGPKDVTGAVAGKANGNVAMLGAGEGDLKLPSPLLLPLELSEEILKMDGFIVENGERNRRLSIHFDDNIYRPGRVELPQEQMQKLLGILARLKPFQSQINITFEGHTDPSLVTHNKSRYLNDNFALSSLRATNALQKAVAAGMDPSYMFAKGGAENSRASRSLSIIVTPREVEQ